MEYGYYLLPGGKVAALSPVDIRFPTINQALSTPDGLLAIGGDLSSERLLCAYRQGIFPWFNAGEPILWWSPNPRMVLFPEELKISRSLQKRLRIKDYEIRINSDFRAVITACSEVRRTGQMGTWIQPEMIEAYCQLNSLGYAFSVETWIDQKLVGGLYGVKLGQVFFGESMFHRVSDGSKIAFVHLVNWLKNEKVKLIDCQMHTSHLASLGAKSIPRHAFAALLSELVTPYDTP